MKLKSIFAILTAGVLACTGLTACGDDKAASNQKATFTVGFDQDFPPFGYVDENGEFTGFDLELLCFLCLCQTGLNALDCLYRLTAVTLSQKRIKRIAHIVCFDPCESGERQANRFNRHRHCIRTAQARNDVYLLGAIQFQCVGDRLTRKFQTL
mgnify:CR=1 FL=1